MARGIIKVMHTKVRWQMIKIVEKLIETMQEEYVVQSKLATLLNNKLSALKNRDLSRFETLNSDEQNLVVDVRLKGRNRNKAVKSAARHYLPRMGDHTITAKELAEAAGEPLKGRIMALAALLKDVALKIQSLNTICKTTLKKLMGHFDSIMSAISQHGNNIGLYQRSGLKPQMLEQTRIIDAIA